MNRVEIISQEQYLAKIPFKIHNYITSELMFQVQASIREDQFIYCYDTETMAVFVKSNMDTKIVSQEDMLSFMVAINMKVLITLFANKAFASYKSILKNQIGLLDKFIKSNFFNAKQNEIITILVE